MPSVTTNDVPILLSLFGEDVLVQQFKNLRSPAEKIAMIWKTSYFQVSPAQTDLDIINE